MALWLLNFGGTIYDNQNEGSGTAVDVWANSLAIAAVNPRDPTQAECDAYAVDVKNWFTRLGSRIAATCALEFVKCNTVDAVTGHQATDPTIETLLIAGNRGAGDNANPVTTTYRISLDDSTRSKTHRGGFYPPRIGNAVGAGGRWTAAQTEEHAESARILINAINAHDLGNVAIWSRKDNVLHEVNRLRVSDVPDNISTRKNAMLPTRVTKAIA